MVPLRKKVLKYGTPKPSKTLQHSTRENRGETMVENLVKTLYEQVKPDTARYAGLMKTL